MRDKAPTEVPPIVHEALRRPGASLDGGIRSLMEERLGADFSHVRVHTDEAAAASAQAIGALAYTAGSSIVFDRGRYAPHQDEGKVLLTHELVHTIQQGSTGPSLSGEHLSVDSPASSAENEARMIAAAGQTAGVKRASRVVPPSAASSSGGRQAVTQKLASGHTLSRQPAGASATAPPAPAPAAPARTAQQIADLNEDITQAIAQKETKRQAVESGMRTSAGVRASYASEVQATAGWTISALLALDDTRLATFGLTRGELHKADARAVAAGNVWDSVMETPTATTAAAFAAANGPRIASAGLAQADIDRMFLFRDLKNDLENRLKTQVPARQAELIAMSPGDVWALATPSERQHAGASTVAKMTPARRGQLAPVIARRETVQAVAAGNAAKALGIPFATVNAYRPAGGGANWGEDRAGWQRVAVGREPQGGTGTVGARIEAAATSDGGLRLGRARIARINERFLQAHPAATDDEVCDNAARQHNAGNPLTDEVRAHFHTFHKQRAVQGPTFIFHKG